MMLFRQPQQRCAEEDTMTVTDVLEAAIRRAEEAREASGPQDGDEGARLVLVSLSPDVAIALYRVALSAQTVHDDARHWDEDEDGNCPEPICVSLEALSQAMDR